MGGANPDVGIDKILKTKDRVKDKVDEAPSPRDGRRAKGKETPKAPEASQKAVDEAATPTAMVGKARTAKGNLLGYPCHHLLCHQRRQLNRWMLRPLKQRFSSSPW